MNLGDLHKVWEIKALKKPGEEEAKKFLEQIAKQVQPIMRKHNWRVKLLSEFCPSNPSLLGLNVGGGLQIKLRLRRPNRDWDFFPFDQVLDTMLHELCHNVHGPHNASFYKLWDELRRECEELRAKGISGAGQGFDLPGRRLGGFSRQPPLPSLRQTALAAAENRARLGSLLPSGPKRLGGDSTIMDALSPIQAAAMAAERRLQDDIWCGSHSSEVVGDEESCTGSLQEGQSSVKVNSDLNGHASVASSRKRGHEQDKLPPYKSSDNHSKSKFVDLTTEDPESGSILDHSAGSNKQNSKSNNSTTNQFLSSTSSARSMRSDDFPHAPAEPAMWECGTCTLLNPPFAPLCKLCTAEKPKDIGIKHEFWSCKFCTLENSVKLDRCSACDHWRYSYGPPVSTQTPNRGT
ncbi:hypothetical protein SLEP1_g29680 [Rubroshorea leprosula]|uniref:Uncharacterized protein n=1 Tax=Rubroshorea leprosula TaxID=152421 RepID=A0AAV5K6M8_9ROSI|nr:hypothetical protein SLEP1_g29680 [Rubroshorea leprosula]